MAQSHPDTAKAFGDGCDARVAGLPLSACPYRDGDWRAFWLAGWRHVAAWWGLEAKWPVRQLPEIHRQAG